VIISSEGHEAEGCRPLLDHKVHIATAGKPSALSSSLCVEKHEAGSKEMEPEFFPLHYFPEHKSFSSSEKILPQKRIRK
jgi:hypothetical protein